MDLISLVKEAMQKDPKFAWKMGYWFKRGKQVDLDWLMPHLEYVLGKDYVKAAAETHKPTDETV